MTALQDKDCAPMGPEFYPVLLGLGFGGRLVRHFQTPVLYWINRKRAEYCFESTVSEKRAH